MRRDIRVKPCSMPQRSRITSKTSTPALLATAVAGADGSLGRSFSVVSERRTRDGTFCRGTTDSRCALVRMAHSIVNGA
jgi:hypothetical protein